MRIGIFPGSFDPLTYGHVDIIKRVSNICDKLIIALAKNILKKSLFSIEERMEMIRNCCTGIKNIEIVALDGLLADYCVEQKVSFIAKGIRSGTDFDKEYAEAQLNKKLAPGTETVFLISDGDYSFISSTMAKDVASYGGDLSPLVPQFVNQKLLQKFSR